MSASFEIHASTGNYAVVIESHVLDRSLAALGPSTVIADKFFQSRLAQAHPSAIFAEATEPLKSLEASPAIIEQLRKTGTNRQTHLVAMGGGIIQDISAFIASVYMRGLAWTYIPTTVLAMVDSCIGGKSSINVGPYKNLVGTFHPPQKVIVDPALIHTLPFDQRASGLIEALKICFCRGSKSFDRHLSLHPSIEMPLDALEQLIVNSLRAKKHFIEIDEFDKNERLLLNFGHTFGHAIEGASHYAIPHGIAVGLGILCALTFQRQRGISFAGASRVALLEQHLDTMIRTLPRLDVHLRDLSLSEVLERFESDKKHGPDHYTLILVSASGEVILDKIPKSASTSAAVQHAIQTIVERYA